MADGLTCEVLKANEPYNRHLYLGWRSRKASGVVLVQTQSLWPREPLSDHRRGQRPQRREVSLPSKSLFYWSQTIDQMAFGFFLSVSYRNSLIDTPRDISLARWTSLPKWMH